MAIGVRLTNLMLTAAFDLKLGLADAGHHVGQETPDKTHWQ